MPISICAPDAQVTTNVAARAKSYEVSDNITLPQGGLEKSLHFQHYQGISV